MDFQDTLHQSARRHRNALTLNLRLNEACASPSALLLVLHLLGILTIVRLTHHPAWLLLPVILLIQPLLVSLKRKRVHLLAASFASLALPYAVLILRLGIALLARAQGLTAGSLTVPEPWATLLNLDRTMVLGGLWVLLAQSSVTTQAWGRPVRWLRQGALVRHHGRALTFRLLLESRPLPLRHRLGLLALHGFGLAAIVRFSFQPLWFLLVPLLLLQPFILSLRRRPRLLLLPESLAPLALPYLVLLLRIVIAVNAYLRGATFWPLVPATWDMWLNLDVALMLATLWALLAQSGPTTAAFGRRMGWKHTLGYTLATVALVWAAVTYLSLRTHGVTGTDPYAYVQMAVDIAERGLPLHTFEQMPGIAALGLPPEGAVPLGHFVLDPETGLSATVWPPGHSVFLAFGYRLLGERGLYLVTPLLGLATLIATWVLCLEVFHVWPRDERILAAGVAVFVLATSYEQVDRLLVPMADVSAQLFSTLTVYFALRATRERNLTLAVLSGLALGFAFDVRYTQVLLATTVGHLYFTAFREKGWKLAWLALAYAVCAAWLAAIPVLNYHRVAFGHPFRVGSSELASFGWASLPVTTVRMFKAFLHPNEFLFLVPFLAWGLWRLWRTSHRITEALLLWVGVIIGFHLFYRALRLRDLLSVFPVLALWVGGGLSDLLSRVERIRQPARRRTMRALSFLLIANLLRTGTTLLLPLPPMHFNTFGYLLAEQRQTFDTLATLIPPKATVALSLNAGAMEIYADRDIVRPEEWTLEEWLTYVEETLAAEEKLFVLVDGVDMEAPLRELRGRYRLTPVALLPLPYFHIGGGSLNQDLLLYEVLR